MDTFSELVKQLQATVTQLLDVDLASGTDADFVADWLDLETGVRQLDTYILNRMVIELAARNLPHRAGNTAIRKYLKEKLRCSGKEAFRRARDAGDFAEPAPFPGARVISRYPQITKAQRAGLLDIAHCHNFRDIMKKIPAGTDQTEKDKAEMVLAELASNSTPEDVKTAGRHLLGYLNPDGSLTDETDRARQRKLRLSNQDVDLMSALTGNLDPQTRALLDVVLAKWASPGFNNPEDDESLHGPADQAGTDADAVEAAAKRDDRTQDQRNHDALKALLLWTLDAGNLGQHNGFPMHVIVTLTLKELEEQTGVATTATGGVVPVPEVMKMAAHKRYYLCLFDLNGRPLNFSHERRTANTDQRLALMASERGCTRPGCRVPAMGTQAHHRNRDHAHGSATGINDLGLACGGDHATLDVNDGVTIPQDWYTRTGGADGPNPGRTEWVPPTWIDPERTGRVNNSFHGDRLLADAEARIWAQREADAAR